MPNYHALLDVGTHALLALSRYAQTIVFLTEAIPNSYQQYSVNYPTYSKEFPIASLDPSQYPLWVWERDAGRKCSATPEDIQTEDIRARSRLAMAKMTVIGRIMTSISYMRTDVGTGRLFQESIYIQKRREAERLKEKGYASETLHEFPYVVQYADYVGVSIKDAAEEILFRAKLDDQLLAKTEILRIRYFNRVKKAATSEEVHLITDDYMRDSYFNGLV